VYWIESDTRQGLVRASVAAPNRIEIAARWTPAVTVYLHDRLVNLDLPVEIVVNGTRAFASRVSRSASTALEQARLLADERRIYAAAVRVEIPSTPAARTAAEKLLASVTPASPSGQLSFWEMYAARALEERFPDVGFDGHEVPLPAGVPAFPERVAIRVTSVRPGTAVARAGIRPGDLLLEFGGEPFFAGRGGVRGLHAWLVRELRATPDPYPLTVVRDGRQMELTAELQLGPYAS
jgi:hypothetical protein